MAEPKNTQASKTEEKPANAAAPVEAKAEKLASDGLQFEEISTEVEAWWSHKEKGDSIVARIVGYRAMSDGSRFYVVKTIDPSMCVRKGEKEPSLVPAETLVGLRDSRALSDLRYYVEGKAVVKVVFLEKVKISGNKTFNTFKVSIGRGAVKSQRPAQAMGGGEGPTGGEDEIPF